MSRVNFMDVSDMTPIARLALGAVSLPGGDGDTAASPGDTVISNGTAATVEPMQTHTCTHTHPSRAYT